MRLKHSAIASLLSICICTTAMAEKIVTIKSILTERTIGTISLKDTPFGVLFTPNLKGLPPGMHGFHVHVNASCADSGNAAGGHYDPEKSNQHLGPYSKKGHLGDLPMMFVNHKGEAIVPVLAPRLHLSDLSKRSLMIHAGGDNYADTPKPLGGGGKRIACGVIE